jgi:hypothetical protein
MPRIRVWLTDKRVIILFQRAMWLAPLSRQSTLAAVKIHRQLAAGILFTAPLPISPTIYKKIGFI